MSAEPEDVAAVEGDKPETCPTCGGPCISRVEDGFDEDRPIKITYFEPLVKGEVVADVKENAFIADAGGVQLSFHSTANPGPGHIERVRVLVVRAKENAGTGGKE